MTISESQSGPQRFLQTAACLVVVAWGVAAASGVITTILLALLLAYSVLPLPRWIMRRFKSGKAGAIAWTVIVAGVSYLLVFAYLADAGYRMKTRLPVYQERLIAIYDSVAPFLAAHGIRISSLPTETLFSLDRIIGLARVVLPAAVGSLSSGLIIFLLSLLFLIEMSEPSATQSGLVAALAWYGRDVQQFIAITAKTGAVVALASFALLVVVGVDFPLLWCVLYFFLQFIPSVGAMLAVAPPTLVALLMLGWERALIVAAGMILANLVAATVLNPRLLKKGSNISFLEIVLSLIVWGTLLGFWGGILAIPLTLVLKKLAGASTHAEESVPAAPH
jgi:AI-2 transport protein TqsA